MTKYYMPQNNVILTYISQQYQSRYKPCLYTSFTGSSMKLLQVYGKDTLQIECHYFPKAFHFYFSLF